MPKPAFSGRATDDASENRFLHDLLLSGVAGLCIGGFFALIFAILSSGPWGSFLVLAGLVSPFGQLIVASAVVVVLLLLSGWFSARRFGLVLGTIAGLSVAPGWYFAEQRLAKWRDEVKIREIASPRLVKPSRPHTVIDLRQTKDPDPLIKASRAVVLARPLLTAVFWDPHAFFAGFRRTSPWLPFRARHTG